MRRKQREPLRFLLDRSSPVVEAPSIVLRDGVYQLSIDASKVSGPGGQLDGDGNGTGGDNFQTPTGPATMPGRLHRLYGDNDGDGDVDATDFGAFRSAFGGTSNLAFDSDGDGDVGGGVVVVGLGEPLGVLVVPAAFDR